MQINQGYNEKNASFELRKNRINSVEPTLKTAGTLKSEIRHK